MAEMDHVSKSGEDLCSVGTLLELALVIKSIKSKSGLV